MGLSVLYAGTAEFAVPALGALRSSGRAPLAVVTRPDRAAGRGRELKASAVKRRALELGLTVLQPPTLRAASAVDEIARYAPDVLVVAAYGLLLPPHLLAVPKLGCLNIHASLLPRWRGAAPVARAIEAGDRETGVCIMHMAEGLDTGPLYATERTPIGANDTAAVLSERLAEAGATLLLKVLDALEAGPLAPVPQAREGASYAAKLDKTEARINWATPAEVLERRIRAFDPWPVAETSWQGKRVRLWSARVLPAAANAAPGTVVGAGAEGIDVATGAGLLRLQRLQLAGRKPLPAREFLNGVETASLVGCRLGT